MKWGGANDGGSDGASGDFTFCLSLHNYAIRGIFSQLIFFDNINLSS